MYIKFTGQQYGDPLVPSIEVEMKRLADGRVIVFHVNAKQTDALMKAGCDRLFVEHASGAKAHRP